MSRIVTPHQDVANAIAGLFGGGPNALLSDFDGTLSPVSPTPDGAVPAPGVPECIGALDGLVDVVGIVTGRGLDDARKRLGVPGILYVGNHGLEWAIGDEHHVHPAGLAAREVLPEALREIRQRLGAHISMDGVIVEDKVYSASIHYRVAPDPHAVREVLEPIVREVAAEYDFWVSDGKMVFELRPGHDVNKGSAVRQIVHDRHLKSVVFLGDDVTDADAFNVLREIRKSSDVKTLSVGVLTLDTDQRVIDSSDFLLDGVDDVVSMMLELQAVLTERAGN